MSQLTVVIPTYNRPYYLNRILNYYNKFGQDFTIIIADSSLQRYKIINKRNILLFRNSNIAYFDDYSSDVSFSNKIADVLERVATKYCLICADDDFIVPEGINRCVEFMEHSSDYTVAHGYYVSFQMLPGLGGKLEFVWAPRYSHASNTFNDSAKRLSAHLSGYSLPTFYGVHRTDFLRMIFHETVLYTEDQRFGELLPTMLTLLYGKMKCLDVFYAARDLNSAGGYRQTFDDYVNDGTYERRYNKFKNCLASHLNKTAVFSVIEAKKVVDSAMVIFRKQRIHSGQMAVKAAKSIAKYFPKRITCLTQRLYQKIFFPWKADVERFRTGVGTPLSSYYESFNLLRNFLISYELDADDKLEYTETKR